VSTAGGERLWRALARLPWGSLEQLAAASGIERPALPGALQDLAAAGVALEHNAQSYLCTVRPAPLLAPQRAWLGHSTCAYELDSTQTQARRLAREKDHAAHHGLVLAERQTAGRGRAGRHWSSPLGAHLYLTLWWRFSRPLTQMAGLSLLVGIALRRCLARFDIATQLKWPNDLLAHGRKLGGVLIELLEQGPGCVAVIGIGLNHRMPENFAPEQPWIDLHALAGATRALPSRQQVLEALLDTLAPLLEQFEQHGFAAFVHEFDAAHALAGCTVYPLQAATGSAAQPLRVVGVDASGQLRVQGADDASQQTIGAGEISLDRAQLQSPWRLLIDCGNTRLKWAWSPVQDPHSLLTGAALPLRDAAGTARSMDDVLVALQQAMAQLRIHTPPQHIVLASSSGGDRQALQAALQTLFAVAVQIVQSPATHLRWRSAYPKPATLGVDRALAMWALLPRLRAQQRVLLVSVGTAMTLDVLDGQGQHHGGLIAAAPALQRSTLAALSAHLQSSSAAAPQLASDSATAVASASVWMAVALIESVAKRAGVDAIWFSGGAALEALPWLQLDVPVHVQPDLVLRGLALA
jgi:biotin-[acetyl-CoA-carboxylase] ligase BirA-like protein